MTNSELNNHNHDSKISAVILDLDGTLLNSEFMLRSVLKDYLASYGKVLITDNEYARVGNSQQASAAALVKNYDLPVTPDQYLAEINPLYFVKLKDAKALPGANRLIQHLHKHQVPFALASNSLQENIYAKISNQKGWKESFSVILGIDQVQSGKPAPDLFLEAARRMSVDASECLVIEDSLVGVQAAKAAGMKVVVVPSLTEGDAADVADIALNSLLEFEPELWGLPPFDDWLGKGLPVDPIRLQGQLIDGLLADLPDSDDLEIVLPHQIRGIYFGWAKIGIIKDIKVVVRITPDVSSNSHRKIQLCFNDDGIDHKNGERVHLVLAGYIRGISSKGAALLNSEIQEEDKSVAFSSLELPVFRSPVYTDFSE